MPYPVFTVSLFIDSKNRIEEEIILPHGRGKEPKIALFASGELAVKSKKHVDLLIKPEEIEDLSKDKKNFKKIADEHDFFIADIAFNKSVALISFYIS